MSMFTFLEEPNAKAITSLEELERETRTQQDAASYNGIFYRKFRGSTEQFSLHEALWQGQSLISNAPGGSRFGKKQLMILTCCDDPHGNVRLYFMSPPCTVDVH